MNTIQSVHIIGNGAFGGLIASLLPDDINQATFGREEVNNHIATVASADVIILAIPLEAYETVLTKLEPVLKPETLLVDVCSVKTKPAETISRLLPKHDNVLLTHPLFGPQSYNSGARQTLVVTKADSSRAKQVLHFCETKLHLEILHMTNQEHDQRMAEIHALTFFIARGLNTLGLHSKPFMTPSFQSLLNLVQLDASHSQELFNTIQNGNPFAQEERKKFMVALNEAEADIQKLS